jgi:predicted MPP superfamily phosphohydrolase
MKRTFQWLVAVLLLIAAAVAYNIYDNQRFAVRQESVTLDRLPPAFDGYRILWISDLHGYRFGPAQARLTAAINALDYDLLALGGDMALSDPDRSDLENAGPVFELLDGLTGDTPVYWVDGNWRPRATHDVYGIETGTPSQLGEALQSRGVTLLLAPQPITRGAERIWFTPALSEADFAPGAREVVLNVLGQKVFEQTEAFFGAVGDTFHQIKGNGEVKILLTHFPKPVGGSVEQVAMTGEMPYDLILAGHYHGGQWRLPLLGAVYLPSWVSGGGREFFPDQRMVKGWSAYGGTPQYVSAGLGASNHFGWDGFRLFNTPEVSVITLRSR